MYKNPDILLSHPPEFSPQLHVSVAQVDEAMKDMDARYNTQFYIWIRNEDNIDYIAFYLQKLVIKEPETPSQSIPSVVCWLVDGWSIQHTAELLTKLFYHWGIGHARFASLVSEVIRGWSSSKITELAVALVIGERASKVAKFVKYLTNDWEPRAIMNIVRHTSMRLKWSERYLKHFLLQYLLMCEEEHVHHRMTVSRLRVCFESRQNTLHHWCTMDTDDSYDTLRSLIEFSMEIFETIVWEMYELRYLHKWNICTKDTPCKKERRSLKPLSIQIDSNGDGLRITTKTEQFMDLRSQPIYEKLASPQASVPIEYFNGNGFL